MRTTPLSSLPFALVALFAATFPSSAENGVSADKIVFGQATALEGPASALGQGMKMGLEAAFAEINKAGGVKGPQARTQEHRRRLRADQVDRSGQEAARGRQGIRHCRRGWYADFRRHSADRDRSRRSLYRRLYRRRIPARALQAPGDEYSRQLLPGNRSHGRASDQGSRRDQNCDHVPGRCFRSGRPCRRQEGARQAADAARRGRHLRAQHGGRQNRAAGHQEGRAASGHHDQPLQARGRVHQAGQADQARRRPSSTSPSSAPMRSQRNSVPLGPAS